MKQRVKVAKPATPPKGESPIDSSGRQPVSRLSKFAKKFLPRFREGATLPTGAKEAECAPASLRGAIIKMIGMAEYQSIMSGRKQDRYEAKAKRMEERRQLRRTSPRPKTTAPAIPTVSDEGVPMIPSTKYADGWRTRSISVHGEDIPVFDSPDGLRYIHAKGNERADLLVDHSGQPGIPPVYRLRLLDGSGTAKRAKREKKLVAHGEQARKARNGKKRAAKKAKRGKGTK